MARLLGPYLDGELDGKRSDAVEGHVAGCPRCQRELEGLKRVRASLNTALETAREADFEGIWQRIAGRLEGGELKGWRSRLPAFKPSSLLRPIFVLPAAALTLGLILFPRLISINLNPNEVKIMSISHPGPGVMVFKSKDVGMTVIWPLEQ